MLLFNDGTEDFDNPFETDWRTGNRQETVPFLDFERWYDHIVKCAYEDFCRLIEFLNGKRSRKLNHSDAMDELNGILRVLPPRTSAKSRVEYLYSHKGRANQLFELYIKILNIIYQDIPFEEIDIVFTSNMLSDSASWLGRATEGRYYISVSNDISITSGREEDSYSLSRLLMYIYLHEIAHLRFHHEQLFRNMAGNWGDAGAASKPYEAHAWLYAHLIIGLIQGVKAYEDRLKYDIDLTWKPFISKT